MLPSIEIRIQNLMKSIQQVVLPAIDPSNKLAQEQAQLVVAHLQVLGRQWDKAHRFELQSLRAMRKLATGLLAAASGDMQTRASTATLGEHVGQIDEAKLTTATEVAATIGQLGTAIDALIFASAKDGSERFREATRQLVLDYAVAQARRERAWFVDTGLDPDRTTLPSIDTILAE